MRHFRLFALLSLCLMFTLACSVSVELTATPPPIGETKPTQPTQSQQAPGTEEPTESASETASEIPPSTPQVTGWAVFDASHIPPILSYIPNDGVYTARKTALLPEEVIKDGGILLVLGGVANPLPLYTTSPDFTEYFLYAYNYMTDEHILVSQFPNFPTGAANQGRSYAYGVVNNLATTNLPSEIWGASYPDAPALLYHVESSDYDVLLPLAVDEVDGVLHGVWFTRRPWGIGGDIVFEPQDGLYYLKAGTSTPTQILEPGKHPCGLSTDRNYVAWTDASTGLMVTNLMTGKTLTIPLDPSSDRGAGNCVFSPTYNQLAWMEGSGYQMAETPNFTSRIRVVMLFEGGIQEVMNMPAASYNLSDILGAPVAALRPQAWLDESRLLLDAGWGEFHKLFMLDINSNSIIQEVPGTLVSVFHSQ